MRKFIFLVFTWMLLFSCNAIRIDPKLSFLKTEDGKYYKINLVSNEEIEILSPEYELVSDSKKDNFPQYLILKKEKNLLCYNIADKMIKEIPILLSTNENIEVYNSISEKNVFIISIFEILSENNSDDEYTSYEIVNKRFFRYDVDNDILKNIIIPNIVQSNAFYYDSKNGKYYIFPSGEGIGNSIPLSTIDENGELISELISLNDFGMSDLGLVSVDYNNGVFFAIPKNKGDFDKIIIIRAGLVDKRYEYIVPEKIKQKLADCYPYSAILINDNKIIIGTKSKLLFFRIINNIVTDFTESDPDAEYINYLFSYNDIILCKGKNSLNLINEKTMRIEKKFPYHTEILLSYDIEIGLIRN